jgi:hypothetical protein
MKKVPSSISSFKDIKEQNLAYIDKTEFIKKYEDLDIFVGLFLRPRRFGKTMFTEILRYYYDVALRNEADKLFKGTWISTHPTRCKASYKVLKFDFSGIQTNIDIESTLKFFTRQIARNIKDFFTGYPNLVPKRISKLCPDSLKESLDKYYHEDSSFVSAADVLSDFLDIVTDPTDSFKLMVIIDEYDNFTNDLLSRDPKMFADLARKQGDLGAFFSVLRNYQQSGTIERIFITGVLPITMDTAVSGFTSAKLSFRSELNSLTGFTDDEVRELLQETVDFNKCPWSQETLLETIKTWYDGYRFSKAGKSAVPNATVANAALCLSFISELIANDYESLPALETTCSDDIDYEKFAGYLDLINEGERQWVVRAILSDGLIPFKSPGSVKLTSASETLNKNEGLSILFHLGFFTLVPKTEAKEIGYDNMEFDYLRVPNEYFRHLFSKYYFEKRKGSWSLFNNTCDLKIMARKCDIAVMAEFLKGVAQGFVNTDNTKLGEAQVTLAMYTALALNSEGSFRLTREYPVRHNGKYALRDAPEPPPVPENAGISPDASVNIRAGRADLVARNITPKGGPSYIFEVKYAQDIPAREETKEKVRQKLFRDAVEQLDFYVTDDELKKTPDLHRCVVMLTYGELFLKEV